MSARTDLRTLAERGYEGAASTDHGHGRPSPKSHRRNRPRVRRGRRQKVRGRRHSGCSGLTNRFVHHARYGGTEHGNIGRPGLARPPLHLNLSRPTSNRASLACGEMTDMPENRKLAANCGRSRSACAKTAQCRARLDRALVGSKLDTQVRLRNAAGFRGLGLSSKARKRGERLWASKHGQSACG
jgi:hypothetical protein